MKTWEFKRDTYWNVWEIQSIDGKQIIHGIKDDEYQRFEKIIDVHNLEVNAIEKNERGKILSETLEKSLKILSPFVYFDYRIPRKGSPREAIQKAYNELISIIEELKYIK